MMKKTGTFPKAIGAGIGAACGRLFIDVVIKPQPAREAAVFAVLAFGAGFLIALPVFALAAKLRKPESTDTEPQAGGSGR